MDVMHDFICINYSHREAVSEEQETMYNSI